MLCFKRYFRQHLIYLHGCLSVVWKEQLIELMLDDKFAALLYSFLDTPQFSRRNDPRPFVALFKMDKTCPIHDKVILANKITRIKTTFKRLYDISHQYYKVVTFQVKYLFIKSWLKFLMYPYVLNAKHQGKILAA